MRITRPAASLALLAVIAVAACSDDDDLAQITPPDRDPLTTFSTILSGANERPNPVTTTGGGTAVMTLRRDTLRFDLTVAALDSITMAHIHSGSANVAGPIVVDLFTGPTRGPAFSGTLASGVVTRAMPVKVPGVTFDSVLTLLRTGNAYVNVHTRLRPGGEVRGQVAITPNR